MKKYSKYLIITLCIIISLVSICFIPISASKLIPTIEEQVYKDLGVKIHIEKLILRVGPTLKVKMPIMHMMYEDGQKFGQFDTVKFYIPWSSIIKKTPVIKKLYANKLIIKVKSDDVYLEQVISKITQKEFKSTPNIKLKNYNISYLNKDLNDKYSLTGQSIELTKMTDCRNYKLISNGGFNINDKNYINYDLSFVPKIELPKSKTKFDAIRLISQIKELDFHSDIITDLKLYKSKNDTIMASGFINIDGISVLDTNKKNPKSFIYVTLLGDKAGVLSNIYTSANKKVYIDGMINNSKKPTLDMKVKTDEVNLGDLYRKVKIIADLSDFKEIESIGGVLNANFTLKGDLNKIKSNGYMKVSDAVIRTNSLKIDKINADIDFSNNNINITNAIGYVNNAPIMAKGKVSKTVDVELLMDKVELKYLCPLNLGVQNGTVSLVANLKGYLDNISHKENLQINNLKVLNNGIDFNMETLKIDTNKNNTAYINNITCKTPETELIKVPSLKLLIEGDNIKIPETGIFMSNSKLTAKSEITNYNNNNITFNTILNGYIDSKDIVRLKSNSVKYPLKLTLNGNKTSQILQSQIHLQIPELFDEPALINILCKLEKNILKVDDLSILTHNGKFADDFKSNLKGQKKVVISGIIEDFVGKQTFKNLRIFIPQQMNVHFYDTVAQLKGDLFVNGKFEKPEIVGQISIPNLFNHALQMSISNSTLDFNKNNVIFNAPIVKVADSSVSVSGTVSTDITEALLIKNLAIKSKYLNTDTLLMYKDTPIMKLYPIVINDGKFYSERLLANVYGSPLYLSAFSADLKLKDDVLIMKNIASEIFNGKLAGSIDYNMKDEHFNSKIMARGVSAAPIFDVISTRKDSVSGIMDFDSNLKGELTSKLSLNGDIKFIVHNGRMSTLGKLEHLLYAQNVVADNMLRTSLSVVTKAITLKDTGLFKYLRGDIQLVDGIANIKMLQSQGPLMALFMKGQYNPMNDYAKMTVLGRLSDEIVSGLGAFGEFSFNKLMVMLTGEESSYNVYSEDLDKLPQLPIKNTKEFRSIINGTIDKPSSVVLFNWISYSEKTLKQKEVPMTNVKVPSFVDELPY